MKKEHVVRGMYNSGVDITEETTIQFFTRKTVDITTVM
jgi:hypothetical protein